jgi:hypothetical protein
MVNVPDNIQVRFHPFLDYTNMHFASGSGKNDFFGYRNHENLYFTARDKNDILIAPFFNKTPHSTKSPSIPFLMIYSTALYSENIRSVLVIVYGLHAS